MTHRWGLKFVTIIFSFINDIENSLLRGYYNLGLDLPKNQKNWYPTKIKPFTAFELTPKDCKFAKVTRR